MIDPLIKVIPAVYEDYWISNQSVVCKHGDQCLIPIPSLQFLYPIMGIWNISAPVTLKCILFYFDPELNSDPDPDLDLDPNTESDHNP